MIAFGRALFFFRSLFVFALAARKRTTEKWGSTRAITAGNYQLEAVTA